MKFNAMFEKIVGRQALESVSQDEEGAWLLKEFRAKYSGS